MISSLARRSDLASPATRLLLVLGGSLLMTLAAKFQVPFYPVPMSMQSLVAIGLGFALGPTLAGAAILAYLLQGAAGLPVFAGTPQLGIGLPYLLGPTGGYLAGFLIAAISAGWLARAGWARTHAGAVLSALVATVLLYVPGLLWLGGLIGYDSALLHAGLYPFLPGDAIKIVLAGLAYAQFQRLARRGQ